MSTNGRDDDLAPVTDLFGARSSRRSGVGSGAQGPDFPEHVEPSADEAVTRREGASPIALRPAVVPVEDWRSPVIGDDSGRSARAEQSGYDEPEADADSASVFAIGDGSPLDPADAPRPVDEQRAEAERTSMRALGRRGVSTGELRKTLAARDLDDAVVEDEIERLTRVGLLDDLALATDLVDRLHDRKGLGRQGVVTELRRRGIAQEHIDQALEAAADEGDDELPRAIELASKRARQLRGLDPDTAERRLSGFLMRKGYGSGVVRIAVERGLRGGGDRPRGTVRFE